MNELIFFINKVVLSGAIIGCIYALGAIGVTLIFGILRFAHFAHADLMTTGAFFALIFTSLLSGVGPIGGLPTGFVVLPLAAAATALLAIGLDRMFYRPLRARNIKPILLLVASLGVTLMLQGITRLFAGTSIRTFFTSETKDVFRIDVPFELATRKIVITEPQLLLFVTTVVSIICLHQFLTRARLGKAMRAMADNADLALISGINTDTVVTVTWIIAGVLAAAGGVLLALDVALKPDLSFNILLPIFAAAIVGGVGRPYGAIAGGLLVGYSEALAVFNWSILLRQANDWLPTWIEIPARLTIVPTEYKLVVPFVILIAVLLWRPTGIFRGQIT
ncbi:MAG: branched-chain amino acid ABC transporter permease [Acidiferrobacterales bacterium]|nr:branched-chain amino acid ABC transporter permease [Acidiferrobacterales bacterium]